MSLIPAFEIGVCNAWIFVVLSILTTAIPSFLISKEAMSKITTWPPFSKTEKILAYSTHVLIMPVAYIYSIFLPLKLGTVWFYVGLPICLLSLAMSIIITINIAGTPVEEPITKGAYRISRNPIYFSAFLLYLGIGIACASWVLLLCAVLWIVIWQIVVPAEERFLLEKYGDAYREYTSRTPRWIGIPK